MNDSDFQYAYCFFCETQRCHALAALIEKVHGYRCICPEIIQRKWVKGTAIDQRHDWLPGYLFVYSQDPLPRFWYSGMIRCLSYDGLQDRDLAFAEMLLRCDGILGTVRLAEEGDCCTISDPVWQGMQGSIVKLDRGRRRCCVEFFFDGIRRTVWVGYEMIDISM